MKTGYKIAIGVASAIIVFVAIVIAKTSFYGFAKVDDFKESAVVIPASFEKNIERFAGAIKIPTIADPDFEKTNFKNFDDFHSFLEKSYPTVYKNTEHYNVNKYVMVFKWKGSDSSLAPILFNSHYDVVPQGDESDLINTQVPFDITNENPYMATVNPTKWEYPAFSGAVNNGRIYGRGTLDMKGMLISLMDSAEDLMAKGFVPKRDVYFVFGPDEEVGSANGAAKLGAFFKEKGIMFDATFDEGGIVAEANVGGKKYAAALVGVSEKGFLTLRINVKGMGGHSSMPPLKNSALGAAGAIMQRLEQNQLKAKILPITNDMFKSLGGVLGFKARVLIANQWAFQGLLVDNLSKIATANAMLRSTTALTQAFGSDADNVLPPVAKIVVNFRTLPGDNIDDVIAHAKKLCEGYDVEIEVLTRREAMGVASQDTQAYKAIKDSVAAVYPGSVLVPYVMLGGTDSKQYTEITKNSYRFMPVLLTGIDQRSIHNYDESITINNYYRMVKYFTHFIENYDVKK